MWLIVGIIALALLIENAGSMLVVGILLVIGLAMVGDGNGGLLIIGLVVMVFAGFIALDDDMKKHPPELEGFFPIGNPTVEEVRYDILGGNDTTVVNGDVSGHFFYGFGSVSGGVSEDNFYKIYYPGTNAEGENIAIPKTVKESETEIVLFSDDTASEYLLEIVTTQQYMERKWHREPEEQYFEDVSRRYKLYLRESTFNNKVVLDGK